MSTFSTLSEKIVEGAYTGHDPAELVNLAAQSTVLAGLTADATELNATDGATSANATTGKVAILGTSGALTIAGALTVGATTISEAEIGVIDSAAAANSGTGKAVILGTSGAVALVTPTVSGTTTLAGINQTPVIIADATPYTVLAANSGKLHIISEQTANLTLNLPVIAAGLNYRFIMGGNANEAQNYIFVATTPSFYNGGVVWSDQDSVADNTEPVYGNGSSHLTFTVVTPCAGTEIEFYVNSTPEWVIVGHVVSPSTPTMA